MNTYSKYIPNVFLAKCTEKHEKVDNVPDHAIQCSEERYKIWYTHLPDVTSAEARQYAEKYLMDWRQCEHLLEEKCFRIKLEENAGSNNKTRKPRYWQCAVSGWPSGQNQMGLES